jgi:hypothetical protein
MLAVFAFPLIMAGVGIAEGKVSGTDTANSSGFLLIVSVQKIQGRPLLW